MNVERCRELYSQFEEKYREFEANYRDTGSARTYNTMMKYSELMELSELAEENLTDGCKKCRLHYKNAENAVKRWEAYKAQGMAGMLEFDKIIGELNDLKY